VRRKENVIITEQLYIVYQKNAGPFIFLITRRKINRL